MRAGAGQPTPTCRGSRRRPSRLWRATTRRTPEPPSLAGARRRTSVWEVSELQLAVRAIRLPDDLEAVLGIDTSFSAGEVYQVW